MGAKTLERKQEKMRKGNIEQWETPKDIYDYITMYGYKDICPINKKYKFKALKQDWPDKAYCNPPHSKIKDFVLKALYECSKGRDIFLLLPARTDTKWFNEIQKSHKNYNMFITGRLKSNKNWAPYPSVLIHLNKKYFQLCINRTNWIDKKYILDAIDHMINLYKED